MKTQNEIKANLAEKLNITKSDANKFVKAYLSEIIDELVTEGKFRMPGVGVIKIRYRSARGGVIPKTKEAIKIDECLTVGLTPSDSLKSKVNKLVDIEEYRK